MAGDAPRVRFAPSPTGYFHVGSARAALFNWLVARQSGGTFVLRIEDTDGERGREEWVEGIVSALAWLGLEPDEGPYRQSTRGGRYRQATDALWESGHLYACGCTRGEIDARNRAAGIQTPGYDGYCRELGLPRGEGRALRFRAPHQNQVVVVDDVVRGRVEFPGDAIDDFVVVKSSGAPLFVLANVVDDIDMGITHVIRGEDLLPTTPKGILVWKALVSLGWRTEGTAGVESGSTPGLPVFAHLPLLVNKARKKLSKRRDPVAVESYRHDGYLPDAFVNYLALLGWAPPDGEEHLSREQLVEQFRLESVNHSPAYFDVAKLTHLNGEYIRAMSIDDFIDACQPWLTGDRAPWPTESFDPDVFDRMAPLVKERVALLSEVPAMIAFLFVDVPTIDEDEWNTAISSNDTAVAILARTATAYRALIRNWDSGALHAATKAIGEEVGWKLGKAQAPIRLAVTGRRVGPPLFESLEVLGPERTLRRLESAIGQHRTARA
ncbi:MAG: glutamate--tRNA ligase [Acidimicrobiales bacterium]